jgi:hypothetical protein
MENALQQVRENVRNAMGVTLDDSEGGEFEAEWKMQAFKFLMSLNVTKSDKVYQGTVTHKTKLKRRSLNARQKASRKGNRR